MYPILIYTQTSLVEQQIWVTNQASAIGEERIKELAEKAKEQRQFAYCPYSNYPVGVALLTTDDKVFLGANCERVSYSETDHGEESAVTAAILGGSALQSRNFIKAVAISTRDAGTSCGRCRQIMAEHCDNCLLIFVDGEGTIKSLSSLKLLLPFAFTPSNLGK